MKTLLFDIDGTLVVTNNSGSGALEHAIRDGFGLARGRIDIEFGGRTDRSIFVELLEKNEIEPTLENQRRLETRYARFLPGVLHDSGGRVLPGVTRLLERVSPNELFRCCVMTGNLVRTADVKLRHFDLHDHFVSIHGGDHDQHRDDLAKRTAQRLRDDHGPDSLGEVVVIGDTIADIRCGHAIGASVIAVATGGQSADQLSSEHPMAVLDDLSDTDRVMELLS